jgi:hypothetical protein
MDSFIAAVELRNRAGEHGFFVESVCLSASLIDATLRMGLVLQHQIRTKTTQVPQALIYEPDEVNGMTERQVYKKALQEEVITPELCQKLRDLYDRRNKVIHRYVISEITTPEVLDIGVEYEKILPAVSAAVEAVENQQLELGVGMTVDGPTPKEGSIRSQWKHGWLADAIRRDEGSG